MKEFLQKTISIPEALKVNNFGKKYKDYASALKNDMKEVQEKAQKKNQIQEQQKEKETD